MCLAMRNRYLLPASCAILVFTITLIKCACHQINHCKKPDAAYFKALLTSEGLDPTKVMMIGNSEYDDIRTAKSLGMGACYIHSNLSPEGETANCDIVMRVMDLPSLEKILCREAHLA